MAYVTSIPNITRSVFHSLPKNPKQQNGARCFIAQLHDSLHLYKPKRKNVAKGPSIDGTKLNANISAGQVLRKYQQTPSLKRGEERWWKTPLEFGMWESSQKPYSFRRRTVFIKRKPSGNSSKYHPQTQENQRKCEQMFINVHFQPSISPRYTYSSKHGQINLLPVISSQP